MSQEKAKAAPGELTDEQVGVKLPFSDLVSAMLAIMCTGLVVDVFLAWGIFLFIDMTPASALFLLIWIIGAPVLFWILYFVYFGFTVLVTTGFLRYYDKKSPPTTKVLKRQFKDKNHPDYKLLHYYHMRGAIIKYSLWFAQKSPFPGLLQRVLRLYGHNEIGNRVMYDNCFPGLEFTAIADDVVMEPGTSLSTHVVESLYGNLVIANVTLGEGAVVGINSIVGPGITVAPGFQMGDNNMAYQNWPLVKQAGNDSTFFNGSPAKQSASDAMFADGELKQRYLAALKKTG
jgi:acetyltransferase-like isoleucine patch superfamily enzyme